ncbi:MAG: hypothetical protein GY749_30845 [Desulfobacteraceae bacterium]|nr:hypothetical protein [Desulfobacteraceae bacterium]
MNRKNIFCILCSVLISIILCSPCTAGKKLVSEARSVIQGIQERSNVLSDELTEFHQEFSARASKMVKLEAITEELLEKGYLGKKYADTPEKYERIYAEYARYMSEIKDIFVQHAPKIQGAVSAFNRSIYQGKDRIGELRSDDMAIVGAELGRIKHNFQGLQQQRIELENNCPKDSKKMSRTCKQQWMNYQRRLRRMKQSLARLQYMKKISEIKDSISGKLSEILGKYIYKEADTVEMLMNYAFNFEQYSEIIGSKDLGGMLKTIRELGKLEEKIKDFEQFQKGLDIHVADMGNLVDKRLDHFMKKSGMADMEVESRSDVLRGFEDQEEEISNMIRNLEKS